MLGDSEAFSGFAVKDIDAAAAFYGDTLGLSVTKDDPMPGLLRLHIAGGRDVLVYVKPDHVPATYTILNFPVADIDAAVDGLAAKGVTFERYDGMEARTRRASCAASGRPSPGSPTRPATSCPSSRRRDRTPVTTAATGRTSGTSKGLPRVGLGTNPDAGCQWSQPPWTS